VDGSETCPSSKEKKTTNNLMLKSTLNYLFNVNHENVQLNDLHSTIITNKVTAEHQEPRKNLRVNSCATNCIAHGTLNTYYYYYTTNYYYYSYQFFLETKKWRCTCLILAHRLHAFSSFSQHCENGAATLYRHVPLQARTHQEMTQRTWTFFTMTLYMYRPAPMPVELTS